MSPEAGGQGQKSKVCPRCTGPTCQVPSQSHRTGVRCPHSAHRQSQWSQWLLMWSRGFRNGGRRFQQAGCRKVPRGPTFQPRDGSAGREGPARGTWDLGHRPHPVSKGLSPAGRGSTRASSSRLSSSSSYCKYRGDALSPGRCGLIAGDVPRKGLVCVCLYWAPSSPGT